MNGIAKLAVAIGLATTPCCDGKPAEPRLSMTSLANAISTCEGVTQSQKVGWNTKARIDIVLAPNTAIDSVEACIRSKIGKDSLIQSSFLPVCTSRLATTRTPDGISVILDKTTCLPSR